MWKRCRGTSGPGCGGGFWVSFSRDSISWHERRLRRMSNCHCSIGAITQACGALRPPKHLASVGLAGWERHTPAQLSGGQQQRVAIARAIVTEPDVVLADEPTGNLDTQRSHEIMGLLTALNKDHGITVLMVTHEPDMAAYARRMVHFVDGKIAKDVANPHPATSAPVELLPADTT